ERGIWYESRTEGKGYWKLLFLAGESRKSKEANSFCVRSNACERYRSGYRCLRRQPEEGSEELHTQRRCAFDHDARGNRRLDCAALRRNHFGFQMVQAPEFFTCNVDQPSHAY